MLIRVLALLLALWLAFRLLRHIRASRQQPPGGRIAKGDMVACHQCGLYVPRDEALGNNGRYYCCPEHQQPGDDGDPP